MFLRQPLVNWTRRRIGLSLQEMLVVVAVFGLLALVFVLSSQRALTRTRVARVKHEHQVLANSLNQYNADFSAFPSDEAGLTALLIPNTLLVDIPIDPFVKGGSQPYRYFTYQKDEKSVTHWILASAGPDGDIDFVPPSQLVGTPSEEGEEQQPSASGHLLVDEIIAKSYDPTNGIHSDGDILRVY